MSRALACSQTSKYIVFSFVPSGIILSQKLNVFLFDSWVAFALLQNRVHEAWALFAGSTMKDDPVYTPTDCFETFPFPLDWQSNATLQKVGEEYYRFRADLMLSNNEGLTKTYNRFHSQADTDTEIQKLRELHSKMDRAVLDAYGWTDFHPRLDFILDYEEEDEDSSNGNERKKPWRYRWIDEDRDKVLAWLLELNRTRAEEEAQLASGATPIKTAGKRGRKSTKSALVTTPNLFDVQESTE
jgi:hypothetical protein